MAVRRLTSSLPSTSCLYTETTQTQLAPRRKNARLLFFFLSLSLSLSLSTFLLFLLSPPRRGKRAEQSRAAEEAKVF